MNINAAKDFDYFVYFFFFKAYTSGLCVDYFFFITQHEIIAACIACIVSLLTKIYFFSH